MTTKNDGGAADNVFEALRQQLARAGASHPHAMRMVLMRLLAELTERERGGER